ncbi:MAG TPA: DUF542 domain-containing protein [Bacillota bacterium]|nr:DUF542 domain-containing protein [Bacillota bacterium]
MFHEQNTPAEVIKKYPQASDLFKQYHINFCCKGDRTISNQCEDLNISPATIVNELNDRYDVWKKEGRAAKEWDNIPIPELVEIIRSKYHIYLKKELVMLNEYVTRVNHVHGQEQPHLNTLYDLYEQVKDNIVTHIQLEEREFFNNLQTGEDAHQEKIEMVNKLEENHEKTYEILQAIRKVTEDFEAPAHACGTYRVTYSRLNELEAKVHEYIHLENNILFPRIA